MELLGALFALSVLLLGCFGQTARKPRFWLLVPAVAVSSCCFVGPPRDRQPLLWEPPADTPRLGSKPKEHQDERLSKRVRAVAIGSAGGILLSLVMQSITPEEPQIPQYYYYQPRTNRRPALAAPPPPQPLASSFSFSSLTTGLLVGLGTGVIIGSSMTEETSPQGAQGPQGPQDSLATFRKGDGDGSDGPNAPHALGNENVPIRGRNSSVK